MKLDDIKLGMKVLVVKDRVEEGWALLPPDIADKFIGKVGRVMGMWLTQQNDDKKGPVIRIYINNGYTEYSFPLSSLEPCTTIETPMSPGRGSHVTDGKPDILIRPC